LGGCAADPVPRAARPASSSAVASPSPTGPKAEIPMKAGSNFIAAQSGSIWVTETEAGSLAQIDPNTNEVLDRVHLGRSPDFLTMGLGSIWATSTASGVVWRVDPGSLEVEETHLPAGGFGLITAFDSLFVASRDADKVFRIDPRSLHITDSYRVVLPEDVAAGFGSLWVAGGDGVVTKIDPDSGAKKEIPVPDGSHSVAVGEGAVWVGAGDVGDAVTKIDAGGKIVGRVETDPYGFPDRISFAGGLVWVAQYQADEALGIDPDSLRISRRVPTGSGAAVLVAAFDDLWIANYLDSTVWRVEL
jgi:streptogramin lyase